MRRKAKEDTNIEDTHNECTTRKDNSFQDNNLNAKLKHFMFSVFCLAKQNYINRNNNLSYCYYKVVKYLLVILIIQLNLVAFASKAFFSIHL